jgi:hypothetical protein
MSFNLLFFGTVTDECEGTVPTGIELKTVNYYLFPHNNEVFLFSI